jgi:hypothetical protein
MNLRTVLATIAILIGTVGGKEAFTSKLGLGREVSLEVMTEEAEVIVLARYEGLKKNPTNHPVDCYTILETVVGPPHRPELTIIRRAADTRRPVSGETYVLFLRSTHWRPNEYEFMHLGSFVPALDLQKVKRALAGRPAPSVGNAEGDAPMNKQSPFELILHVEQPPSLRLLLKNRSPQPQWVLHHSDQPTGLELWTSADQPVPMRSAHPEGAIEMTWRRREDFKEVPPGGTLEMASTRFNAQPDGTYDFTWDGGAGPLQRLAPGSYQAWAIWRSWITSYQEKPGGMEIAVDGIWSGVGVSSVVTVDLPRTGQ